MSELQVIQSTLERAAQRRRLARALRGMWHGLFIGALISLVVVGIYHLVPLAPWTRVAAAVVPLPCLLLGLLLGGWRKPTVAQVARWVDGRQRLQERLSTALEVSNEQDSSAWRELVLSDAAAHAQRIDPRRLLPFQLTRTSRWAVVVLVLVAGLGFVPEYRSKAYKQKKADEQNIKEAGRMLADLTRRTLETRPPTDTKVEKAMESVATLGDMMQMQTLTRSEALKDLSNAAEKLKDQLKELGTDPSFKNLQQAARSASGGDSKNAATLQKQIEAAQKQLGSPTGNPEALEQIKRELEKIQDAAEGIAEKNTTGSDAERQKMAGALSALSRQVQDAGLQIPELDGAIQALESNQTDMFLKDLKAATSDLQKLSEMAKSLQQMQQQLEKMGKDLAEQLKNGQPELAQQTLQKMISQLNSANLPSEQLQKMIDEVSKAADPGSKYGKVGEHLKSAASKMQGNDKSGAAQSLQAASKELEQLMAQMGDAQDLQSTLEALNQAAQSVGTGQGWGQYRNPGTGPGGQPGSGVGTWADENGTWDGQWSRGWDNSGIVRDDEDPRGHTDRGEGELSDALRPDKVRGQFSPGGQMPSITLKGVSIKGTSSVNYQEAATAAQSDAQAALSQEKVPRAYQGSVRDYFDDLKK